MGVQRRVNWISQQRVDVPDMRAIESAESNDFDGLIQSFVTGTSQGYILRGFEISMAGAIGGASSGLQLITDPGAVFHVSSSQSGTFYLVPSGQSPQQLNSATNTIIDGAFTPSAINYVGLEYERFIDDTTSSQVYIWNPTTNNETTLNAPRAQILRYRIKITTSTFASNVLPIATVTTDSGNNVVSITDARWMLFRLGTGGASPNPFFVYPWTAQVEGRTENPSTSTSNSVNPFHGGDKMIATLKDWMNAMMTAVQEIKGTVYWYSPGAAGSIDNLRADLGNTVTTGKGTISHGVLPNASPILTTTGNITLNSNTITSLASTAGIVIGQIIMGAGIPSNSTVLSIVGSTVTMSRQAAATTVGVTVSFFSPSQVTSPGQVNWDQDIFLDVIGSRLTYKFTANPSSTNVTLSDDQVAYVTLIRDVTISPNLVFTNSSAVVSSVGAISWTGPLQAGDWLKLFSDTSAGYYKILSVDSLSQVTLTIPYAGASTGAGGAKGKYAFGTYNTSASPSTTRDIFIANRASVPQGQDVFWILLREDNGGASPIVYVRFIGQELAQGDTNLIDDGIPRQLLQYIGSPMESASRPQYVSALNPGSVPQITQITTGTAASMTSGQYFYIYSSGSDRQYYVWVKKDGSGTDPAPLGNAIGIEWDVTTGQTAPQTAALLATVLSETFFGDFTALASGSIVTVTNNSAGTTNSAVNNNVSAPFAISITQTGTGIGNYSFQDGDSLTLAIKKLDNVVSSLALNRRAYDETIAIVVSGATPPTSLNGPVLAGTQITLPNNSRAGGAAPTYVVGDGKLEVFLNGQKLIVGIDYTEFGASGANSTKIVNSFDLVVGDELEILFGGGGTGGGGGQPGPPGPPGPTGPTGSDAIGGPIAISTKTSNYTAAPGDNVLLGNATGGSFTFTLPTAASSTGRVFYFKKIDSSGNTVTVKGNGAELIDGSNTVVISTQYTPVVMVVSDGTQWWRLI